MKASVWIQSLLLNNGTTIALDKNSVVVFVGPNNSGKSRILSEIYGTIVHPYNFTINFIVKEIQFGKQGDENDLLERFKNNLSVNKEYVLSPHAINEQTLKNLWAEPSFNTYQINGGFTKKLDTADRLHLVTPPANIDFLNSLPVHPIHHLYKDDKLEKKFSGYFKQAFGEDVIVNHGAGSQIPLHIGLRPETTLEKDRLSREYQEELRTLNVLHDQGDGMKSFAGVLLSLMVQDFSINIVDEPEAFLHPPQAKLLGQMVAKEIGNDKQLFLATHSADFLKGLLENSGERLVVIRIQRNGKVNKLNILDNASIKELWNDPLLKHSNILDGLFHSKVVLCESDGDCQFFSALTDAIYEAEGKTSPDILFVQSGGKARFPVVIKALKKMEVPLTIIGDFDWYHNEYPLRTVYEETGGAWDDIKDDFKIVKSAIEKRKPDLEVKDLKEAIENIFTDVKGNIMPDEKIKEIQKELKKASPWSQAKSSGKAYLPGGDETKAFNRVQQKIQEKKIYILEVGEMESFDKTVGGHGPKWVNEVLSKDILNDKELEPARKFVKDAILT
jgi:predicted ATPase